MKKYNFLDNSETIIVISIVTCLIFILGSLV